MGIFVLPIVLLSLSEVLCGQGKGTTTGKSAGMTNEDEEPQFTLERLQLAEKHFLNILGLKKRPRKRRNLPVPEYVWKLYNSWTNNEVTDNYGETVKVLHATKESFNYSRGIESLITVNVSQLPHQETIRKAEFHVYKHASVKNAQNTPSSVQGTMKIISRWKSDRICNKRKRKYMGVLSSRTVDLRSSNWEVFPVTKLMRRSMKKAECFLGFTVELYRNHILLTDTIDEHRNRGEEQPSGNKTFNPFLLLHYDSGPGKRKNTSASHNAQRVRRYVIPRPELPGGESRGYKLHQIGKQETCRRRPLYLNFGMLGWDEYIVAPAGFDVYYCGGLCPKPLNPYLNTTNHAVIQNQVNSFHPSLVPPPCCVPTSLGDVTILFFNEHHQMTLKKYKNMVALGCGCR